VVDRRVQQPGNVVDITQQDATDQRPNTAAAGTATPHHCHHTGTLTLLFFVHLQVSLAHSGMLK